MSEWIAVDLDGTLAYIDPHGVYDGSIGPPVPKMVDRVRMWLKLGYDVRIMTARVNPKNFQHTEPDVKLAVPLDVGSQTMEIYNWCREHIGKVLPVTHEKDYQMIELWDDRAVGVIRNTGLRADQSHYSDGWEQ
jgi:hypothetical protein